MKKIKIVIGITNSLSAVLIKGQPTFLKNRGFDVTIFSSSGEEISYLRKREKFNLKFINYTREISLISDVSALFATYTALKKIKPDIINAGTPKAAFLLMIAAYFMGTPVRIFTLRGLRSSTLKGIKKRIVVFTEKVTCNLATEVIVISPSLKKEAISQNILNKNKGVVLGHGSSNGIDVDKFKISKPILDFNTKFREIHYIYKDYFVIGFVGRLAKEKGIDELVKSFKVLSKNKKIKLILVGPQEKDAALSKEIFHFLISDPNIILVGKVNDIEKYYPLFDVLVLPSHREGFGNVIIESAALGVPSIASNIQGCQDAIKHEVTGLLFNARSVDDLVLKIKMYIDNPELKKKHGENARKRVHKFYKNETIWDAQLELYNSLLSSK